MKSLQHHWYRSSNLLWLLLPVSWLYCFVVIIRRRLYQLKIIKSYGSHVPVIVIGNIVVGGSGKTPLLISLCEYLIEKGFNPGVVSRGYGGSVTEIKQISATDTAAMVGDEPLMVYQKTKVPVVVGTDRAAAVKYLVDNNLCDVVLSDDGLQHYRMQRDFEVAVVDSGRRYGNGFCLPAGPLRERISRLDDVDMVVFNGDTGVNSNECSYQLQVTSLRQLTGNVDQTFSSFTDKTIHAVAGIGDPSRFFTLLQTNGLSIVEHAFSDHYCYQQNDFEGWSDDCIIMTEKDAVKCRHLSLTDAWVLSVKAVFSDELESSLSSDLLPLLKRNNSSVSV